MKHALPSILISLISIFASGCSIAITAKMYPVEGPYSEQVPIPVLEARVQDVQKNSGEVSVILPSGEICKGTWSSLAPRQISTTNATANVSISSGLRTAYATVYGTAFTVSNVPGVNRGTAYMVGEKGTTIEVFFETGSGTANGNGVATDNKGNIYKVIF